MIKITDVTAPPTVEVGTPFKLLIRYDSSSSASARLTVEPRGELSIASPDTSLPAAPGGGSKAMQATITRTGTTSSAEARILVTAGTTGSAFVRLT
jgi:hypothetical protein